MCLLSTADRAIHTLDLTRIIYVIADGAEGCGVSVDVEDG